QPLGGAVGPDVGFADRADHAGPDGLLQHSRVAAGLPAVAHLRGDLRLTGRLSDAPGFPDGVGQGLFAIDVLAALDRLHRGERVVVVRGRDDDAVEAIPQLVQ